MAEVFENLGGVEAMTEWAREHPSDFYRGIYARLLPTRMEVDARIEAARSPREMTDAELLAIIDEERVAPSETKCPSLVGQSVT